MYDLDGQKPNPNKDDFLGLIQCRVSEILSQWNSDPRKLSDKYVVIVLETYNLTEF